MKFLVAGAGGFIGGHIVKYLENDGHKITCVDVKKIEDWFQISDKNENITLDLKNLKNCLSVTEDKDYVINLACNMGGMGFIENNKAECMLSVLINTHLLQASLKNKVKKYLFSSSACVYNVEMQRSNFVEGLKEDDAYPAMPEDGYGWEKLFSERMCRHFFEDYGLDVRVARYHNFYGPEGTFDGGREKAPAALCRKIIEAKISEKKTIDVWGDGNQTRSFLYIDDCVQGTMKIFNSKFSNVFNVGSDEQVSINQLIEMIENIACYNVDRKYDLSKPKGVRGRSSNNNLIKNKLNWLPKHSLQYGLEKTYKWIFYRISSNMDNKKFSKY